MKKEIENAVALLYEREIHNAPIVISKGEKLLAKRMIEIAKKNKVPIVSDEETVKELMHYEAVSIILKYVYKLKAE